MGEMEVSGGVVVLPKKIRESAVYTTRILTLTLDASVCEKATICVGASSPFFLLRNFVSLNGPFILGRIFFALAIRGRNSWARLLWYQDTR